MEAVAIKIIRGIAVTDKFLNTEYGMFSSPNMKDVHDANISFWSPHPYFIAGFFLPQQIFQLIWLYRLYKLNSKKSEKEEKEVAPMLDFVPFYIVWNLCMACEFSYFVLGIEGLY